MAYIYHRLSIRRTSGRRNQDSNQLPSEGSSRQPSSTANLADSEKLLALLDEKIMAQYDRQKKEGFEIFELLDCRLDSAFFHIIQLAQHEVENAYQAIIARNEVGEILACHKALKLYNLALLVAGENYLEVTTVYACRTIIFRQLGEKALAEASLTVIQYLNSRYYAEYSRKVHDTKDIAAMVNARKTSLEASFRIHFPNFTDCPCDSDFADGENMFAALVK